MTPGNRNALRVSLTNVQGEGAVQLVSSLLPAIEREAGTYLIDLPESGLLAGYQRVTDGKTRQIRRHLPNAMSRLVECLRPLPQDNPAASLLVLGDLPLRSRARQTVFVHTPHLLAGQHGASRGQALKFAVMRAVFKRNLPYISQVVVQTELMRRELVSTYPALRERVQVVRQPPPAWLLEHVMPPRSVHDAERLRLFYPAAGYPHKNHRLIEALVQVPGATAMVEEITVTLDSPSDTDRRGLVRHVGRLDAEAMRAHYGRADALFFPSLSESYGLPLVEAMWLGLPIVCANLPYAHELCGEQAIYFDPLDAASAASAIATLAEQLASGWRPDWSDALAHTPRTWNEVARQLVAIATDPGA